jgi:hypothetical protein
MELRVPPPPPQNPQQQQQQQQAPRPLRVPVVQGILQQYNQMPLRFRPPAALRLALRLVLEAGAPAEGSSSDDDGGSAKNACCAPLMLKLDHFTKTGSGQT